MMGWSGGSAGVSEVRLIWDERAVVSQWRCSAKIASCRLFVKRSSFCHSDGPDDFLDVVYITGGLMADRLIGTLLRT